MNNDRELLELAAKACGFGGPEHEFCWTMSEYPRGSNQCGALWNYIGHMDTAVLWNPLTDDGDALRLAVKLGMAVSVCLRMPDGDFTVILGSGLDGERHKDDPLAATRRAIVRAAAEVGKGMLTHDELVLMFPDRFPDEEVERARAAATVGKAMP